MTSTRADQWRAWGASMLLHVVVLCSLAAVVTAPDQEFWTPAIESRLADPRPQVEPFIPQLNLAEFLAQSGAPAVGPLTDDLLVAAPIAAGLSVPRIVGPLSGQGGVGAGGEGVKIGAEQGVGFFGTKGNAKSVVFVVDMSGSMENGRFIRAQQELVKSIHRLHVTQKFYVIFFNKQAVPLFFPSPAPDLVVATPLMKRKATRWITERRTGRGTDPEDAFIMALSLKPEVIYFLTDGDFDASCRELVKEKNKSGTVIHTIALQNKDGIPLLEAIAKDNKGIFKFIK